ncbi:hypothetical protein DVH24_012533 [Malus domestica]|uniref:Small EDRK-rich factor-like N-terminal domain-containing protein n=1 Tax=Malus domestica TaxID=3750 RepID=A0A498HPL4_MALDO|nr:hypothetical protein DVH24_012533 [Malus domestica]
MGSIGSSSINPVPESFRDQEEEEEEEEEEEGEAMGGGNGQKSKMARQRNMEKQKNAAKGSQLESNKKSMTIQATRKD